MVHENSNLRTSVVGKGARAPSQRTALQRRFHHAPITDSPSKLRGRARSEDRLKPRMRFPNGSRCHKRLQREGPRLPARQVFAPQKDPRRLRRAKRLSFEGDAPPISEGVRARVEPVDPRDGRRCRLRGGAHRRARLGETIRATLSRVLGIGWMRPLGVGSAPPTPSTKEKRRRERLMEISEANPEWAVGLEDECWWSREALPTLNTEERGWPTPPPPQADARQERPRAEGHLLLRTPPPRDR
jgi:hypothetical protein